MSESAAVCLFNSPDNIHSPGSDATGGTGDSPGRRAQSEGHRRKAVELSDKVKELVAVGASITANCQPCLEYHVEKALGFGADPGEVGEAIERGKRVRKGASGKMDTFAAEFEVTS